MNARYIMFGAALQPWLHQASPPLAYASLLTDGTPVDFTSCHRCEHKTWEHGGTELSVDGVLDRTRKN